MSLAITHSDLKTYFATGSIPTQGHFWALLASIPMVYEETATLVAGVDFTVTHGNGRTAKIVQVLDSSGVEIPVTWERDSANPTGAVIINDATGHTDAIINVLC